MARRLELHEGSSALPPRRRRFLRDDSGVTAIEFGLLAVPFFAIIGAILETAVVFLSGQMLDSAVQDVSRLIRTGQAQSANMTAAGFKAQVCDRLLGLFKDCTVGDKLHVEVQVMGNFDSVNFTPPVMWNCTAAQEANGTCGNWTRGESYGPGQGSNIIMVQVYYKWPIILTFDGLGLSNLPSGERLLGAATVFRNEPFT